VDRVLFNVLNYCALFILQQIDRQRGADSSNTLAGNSRDFL